MGSKNDKIIKLTAKKFNKLRAKKLPTGLICILLSKNGIEFNSFNKIFVVSDWYYIFDSYKEKTRVQVATQDSAFATALIKASDIYIGTDDIASAVYPRTISNGVYEIDKRDIAAPNGDYPFWKIGCIMNVENY